MRTLTRFALFVGALVAMSGGSVVQAQGFRFGGGGAMVLMAPNVQKELKFTEEQTRKVRETTMGVFEKYRDEWMALGNLPVSDRPAKVRALSKSMTDEIKKSLSCTAEQTTRYDQIVLQQRGLRAFGDPEVQSKLKLTDDQKQKLSEMGMEARTKGESIRKNAGDDREAAMRKFMELRKEYAEKAMALLSDDQKKSWKELAGEPFEVKYERPGQ